MESIVTVTELQADASGVVRRAELAGIIPIARHGRTVAFVVGREKMAALLETLELQGDAELMGLVRDDRAGSVRFRPIPDEG